MTPNSNAVLHQIRAHIRAGELAAAARLARQLCDQAPSLPEAHFHLGLVLLLAGRSSEAQGPFQQAVRLRPSYQEAWYNLGIVLRKTGAPSQALACLERAAALAPKDPDTLFQLGVTHHVVGRVREAREFYLRAQAISPDLPDLQYNLGIANKELGDLDAAETAFRRTLELAPDHAQAMNYLGICRLEKDALEEAEAWFSKALQLAPHLPEILLNLGDLRKRHGRPAEAESLFRQALDLDANFAKAWYNLATTIQEDLRLTEAIAAFRRAIAIDPDFTEAHWNLSHLLLLTGNYREGFQEYRWRWRRPQTVAPNIPLPEWDGGSVPASRILIYTEQGAGDAIQFIRYLPLVRQRSGGILLVAPENLVELFQEARVADAIVAGKALRNVIQAADYQCALLDIPRFFTTCEAEVPAAEGYLRPAQDRIDAFADLAATAKLRVGVVWQGNPEHLNDHNRSCPYPIFRELFSIPDVHFYSLNKGFTPAADDPVVDLTPRLHHFAHTAGAIAHLDLVISVDTSVAHLAGAMGKTTWTLLPYFPDWRWLISRTTTTPWYRSMRLFRQDQRRDWRPVIAHVKTALQQLVDSHRP